MSRRHVILIGLPGSGKSTVGALVAEELGLPFVDLDGVIIRRMGMAVDRIFGEFGEARFRELEREATAESLRAAASIIAPGGGWASQPGNLEAARPAAVFVWLRVTPAIGLQRAALGPVRPLLAGGEGIARITALLAERKPFYERADVTVDNDADQPAPAVAEIVAWLRRGGFA